MKIVAGKLSHFVKGNRLFSSFQFSYRRGLGICDALLTVSRHLQVAMNWGMKEKTSPK